MPMKKYIFIILFMFCLPPRINAASYYVCDTDSVCGSGWSTGNDSNACTSKSLSCKTIRGGIGKMSGGDTLVIGNGTYSNSSNTMDEVGGATTIIPSGSEGAYTTIKAENDLGVIIDGGNTRTPLHLGARSYIRFEGLHGINGGNTNSASNFRLQGSDHIKILRCASTDPSAYGFWCHTGTSYVLFEDCFAYGKGSYFFGAYGTYQQTTNTQYIIFRRCVARRDGHSSDYNHWGGFVSYAADNVYFQNCITLDGYYSYIPNPTGGPTQAISKVSFYGPNGPTHTNFIGCIALNDHGTASVIESGGGPDVFSNCFLRVSQESGGYGSYGTYAPGGIYIYHSTTVDNCYIGGANGSGDNQHQIWDISGTNVTLTDTISHSNYWGSTTINGTHNNNCFYQNTGGAYRYCSGGTGDLTTTNPLTSGCLYPVRIETGSTLKTAGSGGGQIGPSILYRVGASESLYGDSNWNAITGTALWPFPNEAVIKTKMAAYNANSISGARGFCTGTSMDGSAQTQTKYIWEYLGNQIPADIYNSGSVYPSGFGVSSYGVVKR